MMEKISRWLTIALAVGISGNIVLFGLSQDACNDVWTHALHGRIVLKAGRTPQFAEYSCAPLEKEFVPPEGITLVQIIVCLLLQAFGYSGLLLLKIALLAAISAFILKNLALQEVPFPVAGAACLLFLLLGYHRFLPRGDFFCLLFFPVYLYILEKYRRMPERSVWVLPLLAVLWINLHPLAVIGIGIIALYALVAETGKKTLLWVTLANAAAMFANFSGPLKVLLPFRVLLDMPSEKYIYESVHEFASLPKIEGPLTIALYCAVVLAGLFLLLLHWKKFYHHLIIFVGLAAATWYFTRFIGLFAVHSAIVIPTLFYLTFLKIRDRAGFKLPSFLRPAGILLIVLAHGALSIALITHQIFYLNRDAMRCCPYPSNVLLPVEAVRFLEKHGFCGNIYTDYNTGGYVGYHLYPGSRIFIHSLTLWYPISHFQLYDAVCQGKVHPEMLPYLDIFLLFHYTGENDHLIFHLYNHRDYDAHEGTWQKTWPLVYLDESTVIFARRRCSDLFPPFDLSSPAKLPRIPESKRNVILVANAINNLGVLAEKAGNFAEALELYITSAETAPDYELPRKNISRLQGRMPFQKENPLHQKALEIMKN